MQQTNHTKGLFWVLSWVLSFSSAMTLTKLVDPNLPTAILIFIRSLIAFFSVLPFTTKEGFTSTFRVQNKKLLLVKMLLSFCTILCTYTAYRYLPLATATSIGFSGPLFSISFSVLLLNATFSLRKWGFLLLGYAGVLTITNPSHLILEPAIMSSVMANILAGLGINITKILTRTEKTMTLILYGSGFNILFSLISISLMSVLQQTNIATIATKYLDNHHLMILIAVGMLGAFSSFCYTQALRYSNPTFVAPFEYTRLLYAIPVGFIFFNEQLQLHTIIGALLIVLAVYKLSTTKNPSSKLDAVPQPSRS